MAPVETATGTDRSVDGRRAASFALILVAALALSGCTPDWGESDLVVSYYGPHRGKVAACAELSAFQVGNDIENASGLLTVDEVRLQETAPSQWEITAQTRVERDISPEWSCTVTVDVENKTMEADLHTFDGRRLG